MGPANASTIAAPPAPGGLTDGCHLAAVAAAAARIEGAAEHARQRASLLATATAHSGWDGDGARAFEQREHELLGRVRRAASELDDAAAALRQHGAAVRRELERRDAHLGQWLR